MVIVKREGSTATERLLSDLCERSFLKLWTYPSPTKDDGKELCDLLAVFEDRVFVFFDRESRQLDDPDKDHETKWDRWKRTVIDAQIRTAHGAERYLRSGRPIFLDRARQVSFPISFESAKITVHKIIVAHGAKEACEQSSSNNVYGSLAISYGRRDGSFSFPFLVEVDKKNPVHILDSHNLPILLAELDTVFDLSAYLDAKLEAIQRYESLVYCGEEDVLANYFVNYDKSKNRHFVGTRQEGYNFLAIGEGEWKALIGTDLYQRKKIADQESYLWDDLIQRTAQNELNGTLRGNSNPLAGQSAIHEMAKEPRFSRRALASQMIRSIRDFPETSDPIVRNISFMPSFFEGTGYVFLQLKVNQIVDYDNDYRPKRRAILELACGAARNKFGYLKKIVGIAIDAPKFSKTNSEDFILMNCENWPEELRRHYETANKGFNFFATAQLKFENRTITEFPSAGREVRSKIGRNNSCPCGSGKKFKNCCLVG